MIPNAWYPILESKQVQRAPIGLKRMGESLVLFRGEDGALRCFRDRCPHRGVALHLGRVVGNEIECRLHGFRYGDGGRCTLMPCEGRSARPPKGLETTAFRVREAHGLIWLWWGDLGATDLPELPWFDVLPTSTANVPSTAIDWPQNYVRAIEQNFDAHHGPFLHRLVFSASETLIDPIHVRERDGGFMVDLHVRKDDGRPFEMSEPGPHITIEFKFPNLTCLSFYKTHLLLIDSPIDDGHTWRYARYYQDIVKIPLLKKAFTWLLVFQHWYMQKKEDLPVMITQEPRLPVPGCDRLVRADAGTATYLKLRRRLLDASRAHSTSPSGSEASGV